LGGLNTNEKYTLKACFVQILLYVIIER
jgi:hypothetical protein